MPTSTLGIWCLLSALAVMGVLDTSSIPTGWGTLAPPCMVCAPVGVTLASVHGTRAHGYFPWILGTTLHESHIYSSTLGLGLVGPWSACVCNGVSRLFCTFRMHIKLGATTYGHATKYGELAEAGFRHTLVQTCSMHDGRPCQIVGGVGAIF
jgi:hypothetical protein